MNSKESDYGIGSHFRNACWTGKGFTMEVSENGERRISWDFNKGGPKCFKWVPRVSQKINNIKPNVGLGPKSTMTYPLGFIQMPNPLVPGSTQPYLGITQPSNPCFSGPHTYEVGENSSKGGHWKGIRL